MMGNKERVEGKDDTMLEPIGKSLEILTFCALVDREAERVQLLRKKNSMIKPSITNSRIWHPVFELEDFDNCFRKDSPVQSGIGKEDKRDAQEKMVNVEREREERSMKRVREDDGTPPLVISKHMKCSKALRSREGLAIDLNREDDSVSSCGLLPLWYKG